SPEPVTLTVWTGASALDLPVREPRAEDTRLPPMPPGELPPPLAVTQLVPGKETRSVTRDVPSGQSIVHVNEDAGTRRFEGIGLTVRSRQDARYSIKPDDPLSARARVKGKVAFKRGDWDVRVWTTTVMTSTRTHFNLHATLDAFEGDTRVFAR